MKASKFDDKFDNNEDVSEHLDFERASRLNIAQRRVNVDLPIWMIEQLDQESKRLGVTRQSVIKHMLDHQLSSLKRSER